jgi:hypothetical protein
MKLTIDTTTDYSIVTIQVIPFTDCNAQAQDPDLKKAMIKAMAKWLNDYYNYVKLKP